ncbi:helix-turn-helix transcriptional regulator [Nocardia sp. NBC_01327]|uniref:helix-turn-helix transcriptional regulator n=1 Tax=Nocardia sp. NBC_01327 TaxID=2903593 RepID=UPI002E0FE1F2|nr:AAA family ATPase [Nocardia sp. NBC_01327]
MASVHLIGRDRELAELNSFTTEFAVGGGAVLIAGDAGAGKTVLLTAAVDAAAGFRVLRSAGVEFEAEVGYAGLHQLLYPLLDDVDRLSGPHRRALESGLGLRDGSAPDRLTLSNAVRALLIRAAADRPVLLVVDDLHWMDRASAQVLGMVARRLHGIRVGFIAAVRTGEDNYFESEGLDEIELGPLDEGAATALLIEHFPQLSTRSRRRYLAEAQGNPLALVELPGAQSAHRAPGVTRVGRRLHTLFARRIESLPAESRLQLLLAALAGDEPGARAGVHAGADGTKDLEAAEQLGLVRIDAGDPRPRFRHPLVRAAVVALATHEQRRRAHQELAERFSADPDRRAWHLSHAADRPDEHVAELLENAATRTQRRGDPVGAIGLLLRAAELSPGPEDHNRRVMVAAYLGADITGDLTEAHRLISDAEQGPGGSPAGALAAAALMTNRGGDIDTIHRLLVGAIKGVRDPSDPQDRTLVEALYVLQAACAFGSRTGLAEEYFTALERLDPEPPEFLVLLGGTFVEPARRAVSTVARLEAAIASIREQTDHAYVVRIGIAAVYVDRVAGCRAALEHIVAHGRAGGAITSAIEAFVVLGYDCLMTGEWDLVQRMTTEGLELAVQHGYTILGGLLHFQQAYVAAARGDYDTAKTLSDNLIRWAAPNRIGMLTDYAAHAKALAELGRGDYEAAYQHALTVCQPGTVPAHAPHALWVILELVEAAVRAGRGEDALGHVTAILDAEVAAISPRLALVTAGAQAMVATPEHYRDLFDRALAISDADRWPFQQARIQLAYGERLRRAKATTEARRQLAAALDTFDRLHAVPWSNRAGTELRATGQPAASPPATTDVLTPQQREIALLAASGLTNKQIGERLYLSPRTVGTHLYQVFPKLGVTSRAALRDALDPRGAPE